MSEYDYLERLIASVKPDDRGSLDGDWIANGPNPTLSKSE